MGFKDLIKSDSVYTDLLSDSDKFKFDETTIFDRVINLKFTTAKMNTTDEQGVPVRIADEFVIRSDYEIVYPRETVASVMDSSFKIGKSSCYIRRCAIKPSIRVQYTQASAGTALGIDIFVSNFFVTTKDGRNLMSFNQQTYDIESIDIQMGYIGQFDALLGIDHDSLTGSISKLKPSDLFDFSKEGYGVETIRISDVEYVKTEKIAPDYELHIHGYVGSTIQISPEVSNTQTSYTALPETAYFKPGAEDSQYEKLFYQYVTRRFLNRQAFNAVPPKPDENGFYDDVTASKYGIKVICSSGVKALKPAEAIIAGDDESVNASIALSLGGTRNTAVSAIQRIAEYTRNNICYRRLNTGDFVAFTKDEVKASSIRTLFNDLKAYLDINQEKTYFKNILPAVYNINIDAVATIVCPFFTWINPFQQLYFASRYVTSSLTAFYAGYTPDITTFYAINVAVSFATVEDVNEMQIKAVPDKNS